MAGDWIKMRTDLYRDPRVCVMAEILEDANGDLARYVNQNLQRDMTVTRNVMRNVTVGALVSVWGVMRHRGKREELDLVCRGSTLSVIDDIADLPGFGEAMADVGWAVVTEYGVVFPRFFEDYNVAPDGSSGNSNADRQRRYRERKKGETTVTRDVTRDVTVTPREEKRREEKKEQEPPVVPQGDEEALLTAYHSILPKCQHVSVLNDKRRKRIAAAVKLAKSVCRDQGWPYEALNFWTAYFTECATDPWMRGDVPYRDNPKWKQNLDLLLAEDRFAGVMDRAIEALIRSAE
jgi:hypothetical protein